MVDTLYHCAGAMNYACVCLHHEMCLFTLSTNARELYHVSNNQVCLLRWIEQRRGRGWSETERRRDGERRREMAGKFDITWLTKFFLITPSSRSSMSSNRTPGLPHSLHIYESNSSTTFRHGFHTKATFFHHGHNSTILKTCTIHIPQLPQLATETKHLFPPTTT